MKNQRIKKIIIAFAFFLILMLVCTVVSKSIYAYQLPMVSTVMPEEKYVEHLVEAEGIVAAGGERAVNYFPGLRVDAILVHVGDRVEEGDVLFQIDLDDLEEMIKEKEAEISQVSLQINAILENQAIAEQKKELELARAREDYDTTARIQDTQVGRAMESYVQAENELEGEAAPSFSVIGDLGVCGAVDDWVWALEKIWNGCCGAGCWCFDGGLGGVSGD